METPIFSMNSKESNQRRYFGRVLFQSKFSQSFSKYKHIYTPINNRMKYIKLEGQSEQMNKTPQVDLKGYKVTDFNENQFNKLLNSQKLLIALNDWKSPLSRSFLCFYCFGIVIHPIKCSSCQIIYCEECFFHLINNKIYCFCSTPSKATFEYSEVAELSLTQYSFKKMPQKGGTPEISFEYYREALFKLNHNEYSPAKTNPDLHSYLNYSKLFHSYLKACTQTEIELETLSLKDKYQSNKMTLRLLNFISSKGIILNLKNKFMRAIDIECFKYMKFKSITLIGCQWDIFFAFKISQLIRINGAANLVRFKLKNPSFIEIKNYLIIFHSLSYCSKLKVLSIDFSIFNNNFSVINS